MQIKGDFGYNGKNLRFHLTEGAPYFNSYVNLASPTSMLRSSSCKKSLIRRLISNRPYKNNYEVFKHFQPSERKAIYHMLFEKANKYIERVVSGIAALMAAKKEIVVYVFSFCNDHHSAIRTMKFHYRVVVEEIEFIPIKVSCRLFKITFRDL